MSIELSTIPHRLSGSSALALTIKVPRWFGPAAIFLLLLIQQACTTSYGTTDYCPGLGDLSLSEQLQSTCENWSKPDTFANCSSLIADLESLTSPTLQDRFDLAVLRQDLAHSLTSRDYSQTFELILKSRDELRQLAKENPNNIDVLRELSKIENVDQKRFELEKKILELAPKCNRFLWWKVVYPFSNWDKINTGKSTAATPAQIAHRRELMQHGYDHGTSKSDRTFYAMMMFHSLRNEGDVAEANRFRERVIDDFSLDNLSFGNRNRTENLGLICHRNAFGLGLVPFCVDAIEQLTKRDLMQSRVPSDDVMDAIRKVHREIDYWLEDADPNIDTWVLDALANYKYGPEIKDDVERMVTVIDQFAQSSHPNAMDDVYDKFLRLKSKVHAVVQMRTKHPPRERRVDPYILYVDPNT